MGDDEGSSLSSKVIFDDLEQVRGRVTAIKKVDLKELPLAYES